MEVNLKRGEMGTYPLSYIYLGQWNLPQTITADVK